MNLMSMARDEREDLASFLATLSPQDWDAMTLCAGWRVRDVVAHMLSYDELDLGGLARRFAKGRFLFNRINAVGVAEYNSRTPDELIDLLRDHLDPRGLTAGFGGRIALVDGLIHQQDIRRPLGRPREIPQDRLRAALGFAVTAPTILGFWHVRGHRMIATDLDWSTGKGPEVRGPNEAILMSIAGRRGIAKELTGPGAETLARRLG